MKMKLIMENPNTGIFKKMPVGFCWNPFLKMLLRGEIGALIKSMFMCVITVSLYAWVIAATYNKKSIIKLLEQGYKVKEVEKGTIEEASAKLGINLPRL